MEVSGQLHAPAALGPGTHESAPKGQDITGGWIRTYMRDFIIYALLQILLG
jgi:hypothetical protein